MDCGALPTPHINTNIVSLNELCNKLSREHPSRERGEGKGSREQGEMFAQMMPD